MVDLLLVSFSALWLGILTSVSPCPLATNIAAISYVAREVGVPRRVLVSGAIYTAGRTIAYVGLAVILLMSLLSAPNVSHALQKYMNKIIGPLLILVGMVLVNLIRPVWLGSGPGERFQARAGKMGLWGAGVLGFGFALSFCPISAAIYFGSLIPLAFKHNSMLIMPSVYGIGTALPVVVFAIVIAWSANSLGKVYLSVTRIERCARILTGVVFIGIGVYLSLENIFGVLP